VAGGRLVGYWLAINIFGDATFDGYVGRRMDAFIFGRQDDPGFFNAEGFFSTIPAIATVLLGYATGKFVGENRADRQKTLGGLGMAGGLSIVAALAFNTICPINKPIWSSTYVLYAGGLAMLVWMVMLWYYDYRGKRCGRLFGVTFGTNALFAYILATLVNKTIRIPALLVSWDDGQVNIFRWLANLFGGWTTPELGALLSSLVLLGIVFAVVYPLYRKKIFIKL
jgi:predicted acyltransferase